MLAKKLSSLPVSVILKISQRPRTFEKKNYHYNDKNSIMSIIKH